MPYAVRPHQVSALIAQSLRAMRRLAAPLRRGCRQVTYTPEMVSPEALRARQPRELLQTDVFRSVPPEELTPTDLAELSEAEVASDPARVMQIYRRHVESGGMDASAGLNMA